MANIRNLLLLTLISLPLLAESSERESQTIATQATECAALYMILTSIPNDILPGVGKAFTDLGQTMGVIQATNMARATEITISNGDVSSDKSIQMDRLGDAFDRDPNGIYDLYFKCDQWRIEIATLYHSQNATSESQIEDLINSVRTRPVSFSIDAEKEQKARFIIDLSFDYWTKSDRLTPLKFKMMLEN